MKKLFTIIFIFCISNYFAQDYTKSGVIEFGGNISFANATSVMDGESADESSSQFSAEPYIGYFLSNGIELGLIPMFTYSSYGDASTTSMAIFLAPAYVFDLKSKVYPFIEGRIGFNTRTSDSGVQGVEETTTSGLSFGGRGGVKVQLGKNALLNFDVLYLMITANPENWEGDRCGQNVLAVGAGFTIFLGK